jgi:hypothetical protein
MQEEQMDTRERIRDLFPGDGNKAIRHKLYSEPSFIASNPTDDQIRDMATWKPIEDTDAPQVVVKEGDVLTAEEQAELVAKRSLELVTDSVVVVETPEQYQAASVQFGIYKKAILDNEKERKALTGPILKSKANIDAKFKAVEKVLESEISRYEKPMIAFKIKERADLQRIEDERKAEVASDNAKLAQDVVDAKLNLESIHDAIDTAEDVFFASLMQEDLKQAREETRHAIVAVVMARKMDLAPEPIKAQGSRVTYPWLFEIINGDEVDRELCSPDPVKIRAMIKSVKEHGADIKTIERAGLRIYEDVKINGGK